ncbi:MAG: DUF4160 domain-containing protein [Phycisphaerales bacterium]|nr:DUF4160 domain-containing protein [Phycisphaerales bacterium]
MSGCDEAIGPAISTPPIARIGPYRVYFVSHDRGEPPHVHVDRDDCSVKFWLTPVLLAYNIGFRAKELRDLRRMVVEHAD